MPSQWHRLHLSQKGLPPLVFQYTWTREGYQVHLTDLTYIWSEELPRNAIIKRAEEDATTIDPGEDPEQLDVLLEKIGEALHKGKEGAILSSGTQNDSIEITTTTKLPAPLKPLKWSLKLSKEPVSSLTKNLLLPLLKEEAEWESRQRTLLDQIKHKDYVLGKLFDKLETSGVDLGTVFPGAAGSRTSRKGVTRSEAARFVKGIAPFEEQEWLDAGDGAGLATNLLKEISESDDGVDTISSKGEWWRQLGRHHTSDRDASPSEEPIEDRGKKLETKDIDMDAESTASSDVDEFQRQETPPRLKSRNEKSPPKARKKSPTPPALPAEDDEATASDTDDEPAPAPVRQKPRLKSRNEKSPPKAQKKSPTPPAVPAEEDEATASDTDDEPAPAHARKKSPTRALPAEDDEATASDSIDEPVPAHVRKKSPTPAVPAEEDEATASGTDDEPAPVLVRQKQTTVSRSPEPQPREAPTKPKGGLGKIGGKSKKPEPQPQPRPSPSPASSPPPVSPASKRSAKKTQGWTGLGRIGGKKKQPSPSPEPTSPEPQELPEERASAPQSPAPAKTKRPGKLGMIGGKAKAKTQAPELARDESPPPPAASPEKPSAPSRPVREKSPLPKAEKARSATPVEPETEDQRADRKREELKRALEAKGKAPAKKKRRF
ncbi:XLF/Cernunnos protein [Penicillium bovifimosum]|uniref:Non-homologous end-joining factor 1 n=1 Tax=Penicillium bovifimosum TaxID=126998 RepID=A0A9W9GX50_9EURO|nr:XLF/Cernunnos protein [Penicillium bovifimosum]KAJ5131006.1 XLF/Cernunnos protein [Penicillium bovifimosum]